MVRNISGEMYFIFGSIIGSLSSNCTKEDMKNCLSRCNEPDHIFKIVLSVSSVENNCICTP